MNMLNMHLISKPAWAREPSVRLSDEGAREACLAFEPLLPIILDRLHGQIEAYVNDPELTFSNEDDGFPTQSRLTGEYYLSDRSYYAETIEGRIRYRMSIMLRCLERPWLEHQTDFDYLGLEARVYLWKDTGELELDDFDSSVI